jgi:hypothetical protein
MNVAAFMGLHVSVRPFSFGGSVMAAGDTVVGTGATLTFAGFVAEITSISIDGPEATIVDVSHLGSSTLPTPMPL